MRDVWKAGVGAFGVLVLAAILWFMFPAYAYIGMPGVAVALILNGGVHGGHLSRFFGAFVATAALLNFVLYWLCVWLALKAVKAVRIWKVF
jgi:hypothetical protein